MLPLLNYTQVFKMEFIRNLHSKISNRNIKLTFNINGFLPLCLLFSSNLIIDDVFNPRSSVDYSRNTDIKVCDDTAKHLKRGSPNFLTDIGLQSLANLWVVAVHSLRQLPPQEFVCRRKIKRAGSPSFCFCAAR